MTLYNLNFLPCLGVNTTPYFAVLCGFNVNHIMLFFVVVLFCFVFLVRDWVIQCETVMVVWVRKLLLYDFLFERAISGQFCFII